jgi:hypothetical protein
MPDRSDVQFHQGHFRVVLYPDHVARQGDCLDCRHFLGFVTWWCCNEKAIEHYKSRHPKHRNCPFWEEADRIPEPFLTSLKRPETEARARFGFLSRALFLLATLLLAALAMGVLWGL